MRTAFALALRLALFGALIAASGSSPARAADVRTVVPDLACRDVRVYPLNAAPAMPSAASADTTYAYGGPGTPEGKFEDAQGLPDRQGWTSYDVTTMADNHWSVSTFGAANLDPAPDNHAWWCGALFEPCNADDPAEGVGNGWYDALGWSGTVPEPALPCTVRVRATLNLDIEPAEDYLLLEAKRLTDYGWLGFTQIWSESGRHDAVALDVTTVVLPEAYDGEGHDQVLLRFILATDAAWSDEDCLWPSAGGCQIDNIRVTFAQGQGEQDAGGVESCEPGAPTRWTRAAFPGVGDYAAVRAGLADLDPAADNATPQMTFIDDGVVAPQSAGTPCISWCYGPGGYVVLQGEGGGQPGQGLWNEVRSPEIVLPDTEPRGVLLAFDTYVHVPPDYSGAIVVPYWRVRSTAAPAGDDGWSDWRDRRFSAGTGPAYVRMWDNVSDLLQPGAVRVQFALGARNLGAICSVCDGTPAPWFDNVAVMVYGGPLPAVRRVRPDGLGEYATIADAVRAAGPGDTISLADGVFTGPGNVNISTLGKPLVFASSGGDPAACVIDAQGATGDTRCVFNLGDGGKGLVVTGLTLRGGRYSSGGAVHLVGGDATFTNCVFADNQADASGGALYGYAADIVLRDCAFARNDARDGGAVYVTMDSRLTCEDCTFTEGSATGKGGAVACVSNSAILDGCVFEGNAAGTGGAVYAGVGTLEARRCLFAANRSSVRGAALCVDGGAAAYVASSTFVANDDAASRGVVTAVGGAQGRIGLGDCIIAFSTAGRAVQCEPSYSGADTGAVFAGCCDFYGNPAGDWDGRMAAQLGVDGNFSADPLFCDGAADDPHALDERSPCAAANSPSCGLVGARPAACAVAAAPPQPTGSPRRLVLHAASPNPFNPTTNLRFETAVTGPVDVAVYDLAGRLVRRLMSEVLAAGPHEIAWDGRADGGAVAASGSYLVRVTAGGEAATISVVLLR